MQHLYPQGATPFKSGQKFHWGSLYGSAQALALGVVAFYALKQTNTQGFRFKTTCTVIRLFFLQIIFNFLGAQDFSPLRHLLEKNCCIN
jgi:hypothetical protein